MTDFSKTLIRCSALGCLMTEPRDTNAKKNGDLSKSAKQLLINTYIKEKYEREKDVTTKQMSKGISAEATGIEMLGLYKGKNFKKNSIRVQNEFLTGMPDVFEGESIMQATRITDTKLSWDIWTFLANVIEPLDKDYWWQLQGYLSITGAQTGEVAYVLADCPEHLITDEKYRLLRSMNVVSEDSPEYIQAAARLEINMIYPDMPLEEKILLFPVDRDDEAIEKINRKVEKARIFLKEFEELHQKFNQRHKDGLRYTVSSEC